MMKKVIYNEKILYTYYPYKSDKPEKKYYIITSTGKKLHFGSSDYQDFTQHKDEDRKNSYIKRHQKNLNPVLILQDFGVIITYGHILQKHKLMKILKKNI